MKKLANRCKDLLIPTPRNNYRALLLKAESLSIFIVILISTNLIYPLLPFAKQIQAEVDSNSIVYLHNRERAKYNLPSLILDSKLIKSALSKAHAMMESNCWSHYCPDNTSPWKYFQEAGYEYQVAGENLAEGFYDNQTMMKAWMNSKTHKENVIKPEFTEMGVGVLSGTFQDKSDNSLVVVHFGKPITENIVSPESQMSSTEPSNFEAQGIGIVSPLQNLMTNDPNISVKGLAFSNIASVDIYINGALQARVPVIAGEFQFTPPQDWDGFPEGENTLEFQGVAAEGEYVTEKLKLNFSIDTKPPRISDKDLTLVGFQRLDSTLVEMKLSVPEDVASLALRLSNEKTIYGQRDQGYFTFKLEDTNLQNQSVRIESTDVAGNVFSTDISLRGIYESYLESLNVLGATARGGDPTRIIRIDLTEFFASINYMQLFDITVLLFIAGLMWLDYRYLINNSTVNIHRYGSQHLKIGLIIFVVILIFSATGIGGILTGVST